MRGNIILLSSNGGDRFGSETGQRLLKRMGRLNRRVLSEEIISFVISSNFGSGFFFDGSGSRYGMVGKGS